MKRQIIRTGLVAALAASFISCTTTSEEQPEVPAEETKTEAAPEKEEKSELEQIAENKDANEKLDQVIELSLKTVYFDFDSSVLKGEATAQLDVMADAMLQLKDAKVEIVGHTDSQGSAEYNLILSERRAQAIQDYLVSKGVSKDSIPVKGMGEEQLKQQGKTQDAHAANRRGEFNRLK